jgi:bacillithiol system protein YtxJ
VAKIAELIREAKNLHAATVKHLFAPNFLNQVLAWFFHFMQINHLVKLSQLAEIKAASQSQAVLIFKHSTRCSISTTAWTRLQRQWTALLEGIPVYYLDLLNHRDISGQIETEFSVVHQSPQALLIDKGICTFHASHLDISISEIELHAGLTN